MEKIFDVGQSCSSFLGSFESTKVVDDEIFGDTFSYLTSLTLDHPFLIVYRQAIEDQDKSVGNVSMS